MEQLTINITPEVKAALQQRAAANGQNIKDFVEHLVSQQALSGMTDQLTAEEKRLLTEYLNQEYENTVGATGRRRRLDWLKAHQAEYAGQYVALDGDGLVGCGATLREAAQAARQQGVEHPFLVYVFPPDSAPFGGW
ncbi:MAG TPA: DUF5678 domain-containing protein [Blastocatellia bacterium]|nr:DUF5678 domain-containing protein [Blastocatellia bacterium]